MFLDEVKDLDLEFVVINNYKNGGLEISFSCQNSKEYIDKVIKYGNLKNYMFMSSVDEMFHLLNGECEGDLKECQLSPLLVYIESPMLDEDDGFLYSDENLAKHFMFYTSEDVIEVVSESMPEFEVVNKESEESIKIKRD